MLRQLDSSLWVNEIPFKALGIDFGNKMTCIQLEDQSFWLHSPTKFNEKTYEEIKEKGYIQYLITPSLMHNLFVMKWKKQDSTSLVLAPSQAKRVHADIKLDETSGDKIEKLFNNEISIIPINGIPMLQEYAFIHHASKTLILTDLAFNFGKNISGWSKLFMKLYGAYNKFGPTLTIRALIRDKKAFSESVKKIASQKFDRIIVSHGQVVERDGNFVFNEAFKKHL